MGNRYTASPRYPRGGPQLRVPATAEQLRDLDERAEAAGRTRAEYARALLWPAESDQGDVVEE